MESELQAKLKLLDTAIEPKARNWLKNHLFKSVELGIDRFPHLASYIIEHLKGNTFIIGSPDAYKKTDALIVKRHPLLWTPDAPENATLYCKLSDEIWNVFHNMYQAAYEKIHNLHDLQINIIPYNIRERRPYRITYNVFPKDKDTDIKPVIGLGFFLKFMQAVLYTNNDSPDITYLSISFDFQDIVYNKSLDYEKVVSKVLKQTFTPCNEITNSLHLTLKSVYLSHDFDDNKSGIIELDRNLIIDYIVPSINIWSSTLDHVNLANLFMLLINC